MITKFDLYEATLPRESSVKQLKKLRSIVKNDIGDKVRGTKKVKNSIRTDNPVDRKIDSYENFIKSGNKKGLGYKK